MRLDQPVSVGRLTLEWLEVADSRCPIGVQCFRAGEARVTIRVNEIPAGKAHEIIVLSTAREKEKASAYGRKLQLLRVESHPVFGKSRSREDYRACIKVQRPRSERSEK